MEEEKRTEQAAPIPAEQTPAPAPEAEKDSLFAGVYDRLPNIPLKALDIFIGVCVAALVLVLAVGFVQSRL